MHEFAAVLEADGVSRQQLLREVSMTDAMLLILPYMASVTAVLELMKTQEPHLYAEFMKAKTLQDRELEHFLRTRPPSVLMASVGSSTPAISRPLHVITLGKEGAKLFKKHSGIRIRASDSLRHLYHPTAT